MSQALKPGRASVRSGAGPPSAFGLEVALIFGEAFGWPNLLSAAGALVELLIIRSTRN
jgi:hypothetical protein